MPVTINGSTGLTGVAAIDNVSSTELSYVDGVTSAIQSQIDSKFTTPGAWNSWTPVLTGSTTNPTLGTGGTITGKYAQIGKLVTVRFQIQFGSGMSAGSGRYYMTIPVNAATYAVQGVAIGSLVAVDVSAVALWTGVVSLETATGVGFFATGGGFGMIGAAFPFTFASTDEIKGTFTYEAA